MKKLLSYIEDVGLEFRYRFRNLTQGIKNLIYWFPIIWKDRNWDHHYIFEILKFKLKRQAGYIKEKGNHISAERDAEKMMLCVRLIEKVQEEFYGTEYTEYYKSDLDFIESVKFPGKYEMVEENIVENFDKYFQKYPRIYKQVMNAESTIFRKESKRGIALNIAHINEERAHKLLFKIIEENIRKWWN